MATFEPRDQHAEPLKVFISYSRQDMAFAKEIVAGLQAFGGFEVSIDTDAIHEGEDWRARLGALIAGADTVVFILSPKSAASPVCTWEVEEAARLSKRILPVQAAAFAGIRPPTQLAALNYVRFDPQDDGRPRSFMAGLTALRRALTVDIDWLREHTRLLVRAREWERAGKPENRLLSGSDIALAKEWLARRPSDAPAATDLHHEFILASEQAEAARDSAERRQLEEISAAQAARKQALDAAEIAQREKAEASARVVRRTLVGLGASLFLAVVASGAGLYANSQRLQVDEQRKEALRFAAEADKQRASAVEAEARAVKEAAAATKARTKAEELVQLVVRNLDSGWPSNDARSPDYRHLQAVAGVRDLVGKPFRLTARAVEELLTFNGFIPRAHEDRIVIALRGADLGQFVLDASEIELRDIRPDHERLRCTVVILDRKSQRLSAFAASTVPNQRFMRRYFETYLTGADITQAANLMPTGLYPYRVGQHGGGRVFPALRLTDVANPTEDGRIPVRRTLNDLVYDVDDIWDVGMPYNNLHVSFDVDTSFSSAGALAIRGRMDGTNPTHDYAAFFEKLGTRTVNTPVDIVLLTGLDAAVVAASLVGSLDGTGQQLRRLRMGSSGPLVEKLQAALGVQVSGRFGTNTTMKLVELQRAKLKWSDGIYSPEMDKALGFAVFER